MREFKNFSKLALSIFVLSLQIVIPTMAQESNSTTNKTILAQPKLDFSRNPSLIELKLKLEKILSNTYRDRLATQISTEFFQLGAQVTLGPAPTDNLSGSESTIALSLLGRPADTNLGVLLNSEQATPEAREIQEGFAEKTTQLEYLSTLFLTQKAQITKVVILLGFNESVDSDLQKKLVDWLTTLVKQDFKDRGSVEKSVLSTVKKKDSLYDYIYRFQYSILGAIIIVILFLLFTIARFSVSKDTHAKNQNALKVQELKGQQKANNKKANGPTPSAEKPKPLASEEQKPEKVDSDTFLQIIRDLQLKIGYFIDVNKVTPRQIGEIWLAQGDAGRSKIASLMDALLVYDSHKIKQDRSPTTSLAGLGTKSHEFLSWLSQQSESANKNLFEVFQGFGSMDLKDHRAILEQSYWDLLSVSTIGEKAMKTRFGSLISLSNSQIQKLLKGQTGATRHLPLLHLPPDKIDAFVSSLSFDEKLALFDECFALDAVPDSEIERVDEQIRQITENQSSAATTAAMVSLKEMTINLLPSLSVRDEFSIIPQALSKQSDGGLDLKKSYPSLVFVKEWPLEQLRILFDQVDSAQIMAYLMMEPTMKDSVLKILPPKAATILRDELQRGPKASNEDIDKQLEQLKERLNNLVADEKINLELLFSKTEMAA